ncbi:uncharacterized protein ASPGLDRAFT_66355 [Aspergillus glaucus CBS 516.65]|uniref:ER membrane protein complex subunit 10 n=1 Tax=Aspergillus glaucus CBS 516.65 TaxID=1160497 RepID=A0A1L9VLX2_ASPGL|nr:hypothetical protein ASPGLDRAFT_66355 [Aspergillus glaucus CBS 516.65]OJJ84891.1 hypothetical protein ASPGLDRAFT_66355 [Aspergillus glaucus CBS 516.65]
MLFSPIILPILSSLVLFVAAASSSEQAATDILYWPVASHQPSTLGRVSYDPTSLESNVLSYSPPAASRKTTDAEDHTDKLVRVGLYTSTPANPKQWVGTLTSLSSLTGVGDAKPTIQLHLGPSNEVYRVSLRLSSSSSSSDATEGIKPGVELVRTESGPRPHLNRPIVISPDGQGPQEVVEKTFFQKYWWVFLIVTFLAMSGGGEGQQ